MLDFFGQKVPSLVGKIVMPFVKFLSGRGGGLAKVLGDWFTPTYPVPTYPVASYSVPTYPVPTYPVAHLPRCQFTPFTASLLRWYLFSFLYLTPPPKSE